MRTITVELTPLEITHVAYALRTTVRGVEDLCASYRELTGEELEQYGNLAAELLTLAQRLEDAASAN